MSRSNHYRLCERCTIEEICEFHSRWSKYKHRPQRLIPGRRPWRRKARWPKYSIKSWHSTPSRWWWREQHAKARAIYRGLMRDDDPVLPRERDLIDLWGWY